MAGVSMRQRTRSLLLLLWRRSGTSGAALVLSAADGDSSTVREARRQCHCSVSLLWRRLLPLCVLCVLLLLCRPPRAVCTVGGGGGLFERKYGCCVATALIIRVHVWRGGVVAQAENIHHTWASHFSSGRELSPVPSRHATFLRCNEINSLLCAAILLQVMSFLPGLAGLYHGITTECTHSLVVRGCEHHMCERARWVRRRIRQERGRPRTGIIIIVLIGQPSDMDNTSTNTPRS